MRGEFASGFFRGGGFGFSKAHAVFVGSTTLTLVHVFLYSVSYPFGRFTQVFFSGFLLTDEKTGKKQSLL
jgi:hypothetical protein